MVILVTTKDSNPISKTYHGMTGGTFKKRYRGHKYDFKHKDKYGTFGGWETWRSTPDPTTNSRTPNSGFTTIFEQLEQVLPFLYVFLSYCQNQSDWFKKNHDESGLVVGSGEEDQWRRVLYFSSEIEINAISSCVFVFQSKHSWCPPISFSGEKFLDFFYLPWNPQNFQTSLIYAFIGRS